MQIQVTLTRAQEAALRAHVLRTHPDPSDGVLESAVVEQALSAFDRLRDHYRTDVIPSTTFIRRIPPASYAAILAAAEQVPQLSAYLARLDAEPVVWLGSPETQAGVAALVAVGLLTQGQADTLLAFDLPELPE